MKKNECVASNCGLVLAIAAGLACSDRDAVLVDGLQPEAKGVELEQTLFVAHEGSLVSYDIETGEERPGAVQGVSNPTDLQALDDGTLLVNLTDQNHVLEVDRRSARYTRTSARHMPERRTGWP
jgi:hypothetical protein